MKTPARKECPRCRYTKATSSFRGEICLACQRSEEQAVHSGAEPRFKLCLRCGKCKSVSDYWHDRTKHDGLRPECKACRWMKSRDHLGRRGWRPDVHRPEGKTCFSCRQEKRRSAFSRLSKTADGLSPVCRACKSFQRARCAGRLFDSNGHIQAPRQRTRWLDERLPVLAADLARRLSEGSQDSPPAKEISANRTPQDLWTNGHSFQLISPEQWRQCLWLICSGVPVRNSIKMAAIQPNILRQYLRADKKLRARWEYAKFNARRLNWSPLLIDEIIEEVATTGMSLKQVVTARGANYDAFLKLTQRDPALEEMYLQAKFVQATNLGDELITEADRGGGPSAMRRAMWRLDAMAPRRLRKQAQSMASVQAGTDLASRLREARRRAGRKVSSLRNP